MALKASNSVYLTVMTLTQRTAGPEEPVQKIIDRRSHTEWLFALIQPGGVYTDCACVGIKT
jgi:hypothetical protein